MKRDLFIDYRRFDGRDYAERMFKRIWERLFGRTGVPGEYLANCFRERLGRRDYARVLEWWGKNQ